MIDYFIDFGIYATLMIWSFIKCAFMGLLMLAPLVFIYSLCAAADRGDRMAKQARKRSR